MIPAAWLDGYRRLYPLQREPAAIGGPRQQRTTRQLARALAARDEDGRVLGAYRFTFYLNGAVEVTREVAHARS
jgi:hypothetical protein